MAEPTAPTITDEAVTAAARALAAFTDVDYDSDGCDQDAAQLAARMILMAAVPHLADRDTETAAPAANELKKVAAEVRESATLPPKDQWDSGWRSGIGFAADALERRAASLGGGQA